MFSYLTSLWVQMEPKNINCRSLSHHLLSISFPFSGVSSSVSVCSLAGRSTQPSQQGLLPTVGPPSPVIASGSPERTEYSVPVAPIASTGTVPFTEAALNFSITKHHGTGAPLYSVLHIVTWTLKENCLDPKSHKVLLAKSPWFLP